MLKEIIIENTLIYEKLHKRRKKVIGLLAVALVAMAVVALKVKGLW